MLTLTLTQSKKAFAKSQGITKSKIQLLIKKLN